MLVIQVASGKIISTATLKKDWSEEDKEKKRKRKEKQCSTSPNSAVFRQVLPK